MKAFKEISRRDLSTKERLDCFKIDIQIFYDNLASMKNKKSKEIIIGILHSISISGNNLFCSFNPEVISMFKDKENHNVFMALYKGKKIFIDGKRYRSSGGRRFDSYYKFSDENGKEQMTIKFADDFVAYLVGGFDMVASYYDKNPTKIISMGLA